MDNITDEVAAISSVEGFTSYEQYVILTVPLRAEVKPSSQEEFARMHSGHESQHSTMALILLVALFSFQFLILYWKQKHYQSFQIVTLIGLWLIPMYLFGIYFQFLRFLTIWTLYSALNGYILHLASRKPLDQQTPKLVYRWFAAVYKVSYTVGIFGYILLMLQFFEIVKIFYDGGAVADLGIMLLSYGLYFGVLSRDIVEICTDRMASALGYYTKDGLPSKGLKADICAICGGTASSVVGEEDEKVHQLSCRHLFHEECIRGWCLIGKKDICPYCKEKVDMKEFKTNPWDTQQQLYLSLLDGVRYLVVWQPIILVVVHLAYHMFGLE
ncbi:2275_t:CDS:2 [Paraglomus brasilianum]|uniref:2275_t:CDS:1 n=1 Tax=Paraglomus brasilianum TaxID=144538 RepID=A0A9N8Z7H8_9GLOM|nr:2275_t:CDS:2 [Paraglomus brasilianum]